MLLQKKAICDQITGYGQQLIDTPNSNLSKYTKEVVDLLTATQKDLEELDAKLDGEEADLNLMKLLRRLEKKS